MADWNVDLMKHQSHDKTGEFLDMHNVVRTVFPLDFAANKNNLKSSYAN